VKRANKSQPEPDCLTDYRSSEPEATWDQFKDERQTCYKTHILPRLEKDQRGLCGYCEVEVTATDRQVAHFHPKSDSESGHNWHLDWNNLWLACKGGTQKKPDTARYLEPLKQNISCDERKGADIVDADVFSPSEIPAFPLIFKFVVDLADQSASIMPDEIALTASQMNVGRATQTIGTFNLNCRRIAQARQVVLLELEKRDAEARLAGFTRQQYLEKVVAHGLSMAENLPRYFTLRRWFWGSAAESYLQNINYQG